jgi:poly(3-hydroxybutyrate) depolymerase
MLLLESVLKLAAFAGLASSASLKQVTSFGSNPTGVQMFIYVPDKLAASPAVIVAVSQQHGTSFSHENTNTIQLHPCGGSAQQWYSGTKLPSYADQLGFIIIYAGTTKMSNVNNLCQWP